MLGFVLQTLELDERLPASTFRLSGVALPYYLRIWGLPRLQELLCEEVAQVYPHVRARVRVLLRVV